MGTLTVRENLHFSAALRLPKSTTGHQRSAQVETILLDLGLTQVADSKVLSSVIVEITMQIDRSVLTDSQTDEQKPLFLCIGLQVGTEFIRGISGGERKRTNIGMELIISPSVLFLDEPTTGLDAFTAVSVMKLLST